MPVALIRRDLLFARAAKLETTAAVLGMIAGVGIALALHSAVALALGQLVGAALLLGGSATFVRKQLRFEYEHPEARELFAFSSQVSLLGFTTFVANTLPSWVTARVFGSATLGILSLIHI